MSFYSFNARSWIVSGLIIGSLGISAFINLATNPASTISASEGLDILLADEAKPKTAGELPEAPKAAAPAAPAEDPRQTNPRPSPADHPDLNRVPVPVEKEEAGVAKTDAPIGILGVHLSSDGFLPGRLNILDPVSGKRIPAMKLTINFVKRGNIVVQTKPGVGGVFQVEGLPLGVCSMIATGPDGYFVCAILVRPPLDAKSADAAPEDENRLQIDADVIHPASAPLVRLMIRERLFPSINDPNEGKNEIPDAILRQRGKPFRTPILTLSRDGHIQIRLNHVHPETAERIPVGDSVAFMIRDGVIVSKATVDASGIGEFAGVTPGPFSLLVVPLPTVTSPLAEADKRRPIFRGYSALGVMVVESALPDNNRVEARPRRDLIQLVSAVRMNEMANAAGPSDIDLAPMEDVDKTINGSMDGIGGAPLVAGPFEGGPAGVGGPGGGGGDLTPLLFGGALAGLLAAGTSNLGNSGTTINNTVSGGGGGGGGGTSPKSTQ